MEEDESSRKSISTEDNNDKNVNETEIAEIGESHAATTTTNKDGDAAPEQDAEEEEQGQDEEEQGQDEEEQGHDEEEQGHDEEEQGHDVEEQGHDEEEQGQDEEEEEQQVASFPIEEDSMSRDSSAVHGLGDESRDADADNNDGGTTDPIADNKMEFADDEQSMDEISSSVEHPVEENKDASSSSPSAEPEVIGEESSDSKISSSSKEKEVLALDDENPNQEDTNADDGLSHLLADESMLDEDEEGENVVAEVDISSMMEINFEEDSENSQGQINQNTNNNDGDEPEVIPIDSDDESGDVNNKETQPNEEGDEDESQPVVLEVSEAIYQVDEDENITEVNVASDLGQVEVEVEEDSTQNSNDSTPSRRPRRAAAEAAAKTIHKISSEEQDIPPPTAFRTRRKSQEDKEFNVNDEIIHESQSSPSPNQRCIVCKKNAPCSIVVRQYGSDIFLCSNTCFNKFRNQGNDSRTKTLPCSKCGIMEGESVNSSVAYFWETMNFCSDLCVGRYQMDVGSKCCTCGNNVPWNSLGKYCVRFGSDIRQFCTPQCLENYKKNARVCFNCQLDIRRSGNVILANIPAKNAPKEFCSNDCVEMYCERNMHQPTRAKPQPEHFCCMCRKRKTVYREIMLVSGSFKTCSEACWRDALHAKGILKAEKCEMCTKFVNMDLGFTTPVYWLSTMHRIYGFCSHVCKNLYILNGRRILACTTCKVKKYNFDLIEYFTNSSSAYAVCSLACLPKPADYLKNIRDVLYIPQPTSDKNTFNLGAASSLSVRSRRKQNNGGPGMIGNEVIELDNDDDDSNFQIGDSDRILDILSIEEIEAVIKFLENRPKTRDMKCMAKPKTRTVGTQTDVSELNDMGRIPLAPNGKDDDDDDESTDKDKDKSETLQPSVQPVLTVTATTTASSDTSTTSTATTAGTTTNNTTEQQSSEKNVSEVNDMGRIPPVPDDNDESSDKDKDKSETLLPSVEPVLTVTATTTTASASSNTSETTSTVTISGTTNNTTEQQSSKKECYPDVKITAEFTHANTTSRSVVSNNNNNPIAPTPMSISSPPDISSRGGGPGSSHSFPSPNYSQDSAYQTSIYPSPNYSNYSPTYGSSPVPPLTPVMNQPLMNHNTPPPIRDYGSPPLPPSMMAPQVTGAYSSYDVSPSRPYIQMPPAVPIIRPPVVPVGSGYGTHSTTSSSMGYASNAPPPSLPLSTIIPQHPSPKNARVENALRAWKMMFGPLSDPRSISSMELSSKLADLVNRGSKPNGERYRADVLLYISLGIQQLLRDNSRVDKIFYDNVYYNFVLAFTDRSERELTVGIHAKIEEMHFWETSELGASSPGVLLFTLIFMFYKHFGLKTWEMHAALQFSNIVVQSRYNHFGRLVKYMTVVGLPGVIPTEIQEDITTPERCLIKMYEFYCFKSESRIGPFYKCLRQDYTPRTPWFTSQQLDQRHVYQMLVRASMINNSHSFS